MVEEAAVSEGFHALLEARGIPVPHVDIKGNALLHCIAPGHEDKDPSCSVSQRGVWQCFGCGASGNAYQWLTRDLGLAKAAAMEELARYGLARPREMRRKGASKRTAGSQGKGDTYLYTTAEGAQVGKVERLAAKEGKKRFAQYHIGKEGEWAAGKWEPQVLYRLPEIGAASHVLVVEGEKCVEALRGLGSLGCAVTTWAGGASTGSRSYLALVDLAPLEGKNVLLWPDNDEPGLAAMFYLQGRLGGAEKAQVLAPLGGAKGRDVADWIAEGATASDISRYLRTMERLAPPEGEEPEEQQEEEPEAWSALAENAVFRVLGVEEQKLVVHNIRTGLIERYRFSMLSQSMSLLAIASKEWWVAHLGLEKWGAEAREAIGEALIALARRRGIYRRSAEAGPGVYLLHSGSVIHLGDRIHEVAAGEETPVGLHTAEGRVWRTDKRLPSPSKNGEAGSKALAALAEALQGYRFAMPADASAFLGWHVCSLLSGCLSWRPHIWLSAASGTGKTWLIAQVSRPLLGEWAVSMSASFTAAAIRRLAADGARPLIIDEAEMRGPDRRQVMEGVLAVMRAASTGEAATVTASREDAHAVDLLIPLCSVMLASAALPGFAGYADRTRISTIRLSPRSQPAEEWQRTRAALLAALEQAEAARSLILRSAAPVMRKIEEAQAAMTDMGKGTRHAQQQGALAGAAAWASARPMYELLGSFEAAAEDTQQADWEVALETLLDAPIERRGERGIERVAVRRLLYQALQRGAEGSEAAKVLDGYGIKATASRLYVAGKAPALRRLLRGTDFADADMTALLSQAQGAEVSQHQVRFGEEGRRRAVAILPLPKEALGEPEEEQPEEREDLPADNWSDPPF